MDRYSLHQLTSTRYLAMGIKEKMNQPIGNSIAMIGGINYDFLPGFSTLPPQKSKKSKSEQSDANKRSSTSASIKLSYLEGTKNEVKQIYQVVSEAKWNTILFEQNEALEDNILQLEDKEAKDILHFATH